MGTIREPTDEVAEEIFDPRPPCLPVGAEIVAAGLGQRYAACGEVGLEGSVALQITGVERQEHGMEGEDLQSGALELQGFERAWQAPLEVDVVLEEDGDPRKVPQDNTREIRKSHNHVLFADLALQSLR